MIFKITIGTATISFESNGPVKLNGTEISVNENGELDITCHEPEPCPEPQTKEDAEPVFFDGSQSKQAVQFTVDAEGQYDDGLGRPPLVGIYKNAANSKNVEKGWPTHIGFDITQTNTIGFQMTSGVTIVGGQPSFKVLENGEDKTAEWGTGSKEFPAGVIPNIKFIYVNPQQ